MLGIPTLRGKPKLLGEAAGVFVINENGEGPKAIHTVSPAIILLRYVQPSLPSPSSSLPVYHRLNRSCRQSLIF